MKIAVIIAVYNEGKNIEKLISSLLQQTRLPDEIIIVDDGSQDNTYEKLLYMAEQTPYLKVFTQKNLGPATARNKAWRASSSDICLFTDGDCVPEKNWLEEMIKPFIDESVGATAGTYSTMNQHSILARFIGYEIAWKYRHCPKSVDAHGTYNLAIRRTILLEVNGFNENYPKASGEDWDLTYKISKISKIIFIPTSIVAHDHPEKFWKYMQNQMRRGFDRYKIYKDHPEKKSGDEYTSKLIKYQVLSSGLLIVFLILSIIFNNISIWIISFLLFMFLFLSSLTPLLFKNKDYKSKIFGVLVQFTRHFFWFYGYSLGYMADLSRRYKKSNKDNPNDKSWNVYWDTTNPRFKKISWSKKRIIKLLDKYLCPRKCILDAGSGSGFFSDYFLKKQLCVSSLDYSKTALDLTKSLTKNKCNEYLQQDLLADVEEHFLEKFDYIFTDGLFEHFTLSDQNKIITNLSKMLKHGGYIFTFVPNKYSWWTIVRPFFMPSVEEVPMRIKSLINLHNGFEVKESNGINFLPFRVSPDFLLGKHFGMLIYVVGRKV